MAKKPKLSKNQKRQVSINRSKRMLSHETREQNSSEHLGAQQPGRVISRFGKHAIVEDEQRQNHKCHIRRTVESVVCGDHVLFRPSESDEQRDRGIIEVVLDRKSTLTRPDYYDGVKPIAANIDQIIVVSSIVPALSTHIIDRYLVACEDAQISPVLVINKVELLNEEALAQVNESLAIYRQIGYELILTSCQTDEGLSELSEHLIDKVSVFVGQSGVGKSSIVNQLLPNAAEPVGDVSANSGLGQHTTTASKLLHFAKGGELIDSPGVREFGLWHLNAEAVTSGFIEFRDYIGGCKFSDCKHRQDPGCLIVAAVKEGKISEERYNSYIKIIDSLDQNRPSYAKG
ncbi:small ribosomal subunit biogenesis GTPase RsgA [Glaciecola sp. XM2]|uniref:small ribosomal subunit biogenesis GTPase RsgA n=1 Tax=Glaciecola sp. XM2 TaxID=1914931 RepID=UPI001BDEBB15|nr:small ribosomal subunit biogenesis GTPase RsgA [Glaciecola sp. XM2]